MSLKREQILERMNYLKLEYMNIKETMLKYLSMEQFKVDLDLNELFHIKLYEITKIIKAFENNIEKIENNSIFESNEHRIYEYFDDKFMDNLNDVLKNIKYQLSVIENNIN